MSVGYFDQLLHAASLCVPTSSWVLVIHWYILSQYLYFKIKISFIRHNYKFRAGISTDYRWTLQVYFCVCYDVNFLLFISNLGHQKIVRICNTSSYSRHYSGLEITNFQKTFISPTFFVYTTTQIHTLDADGGILLAKFFNYFTQIRKLSQSLKYIFVS